MPDLQTNDARTPENAFPVNAIPTDVPEGVEEEVEQPLEVEGEAAPQVSAEEQAAQSEASKYGWEDKDAWVAAGKDPSRWRPASEFLDVRTNVLAITRKENQELRAQVAALKARTDAKEQKENEDRARLQRESLRLELRQAREDEDWDKVDAIGEKLLDLKVAEVVPPKPAPTQTVDPEVKAAFEDFGRTNPWLKSDRELAVDFALELQKIIEAKVATDIHDALAQARRRVIRANPGKFSKGNGRASMTEMGGSPATSSGARGWNDLKPEYRTQAVSDQIKAKKFTLKDYLSNCDDECFRR